MTALSGTQTVEENIRREALSFFFDDEVKVTPTTGGVNNVCNYVETSDGQR